MRVYRKANLEQIRRGQQLLINLFYFKHPDGSYQNDAGTVAVVSDVLVADSDVVEIVFFPNRDTFEKEINHAS